MIATDGAGLLRAILDDPHDDVPRLVYADWLEEHGDETERVRAEFIRVQIELHALETAVHDCVVLYLSLWGYETSAPGCRCRPCDLRRRERAAWRAKAGDGGFAIPPSEIPGMGAGDFLPSESRPGRGELVWRRGFPDSVRLSLAAACDHLPRLAREHPLTRVEITDLKPTTNMIGLWSDDVADSLDADRFGWADAGDVGPNMEWALPPDVFALLPPSRVGASSGWWATRRRASAVTAASEAWLAWAKEQK